MRIWRSFPTFEWPTAYLHESTRFFLAGTRYPLIRRVGFPLVIADMNPVVLYCLAHLIDGFVINSFYTHSGHGPFRVFGLAYEPPLTGLATMAVFYLILRWMYHRNLFIRI